VALGATLFRRDYNAFNYIGDSRNTTYQQVSTGFQLVTGVPLTEYWTFSGRYTLMQDKVSLDQSSFYTDGVCDPLKAGRYYCDAVGTRITSLVGLSLIYDSLNSRLHPSAGNRLVTGLDFAGLGGDVRYVRGRFDADKYWKVLGGFIFSLSAEGGFIHSFETAKTAGSDPVRITDRFYLGEPQFRGFDIRGVGPRVQRISYTGDPNSGTQALITDRDQIVDDSLGGRYYYLGKAELEIPLGAGAAELGLRPSIFLQVGALWGVVNPGKTITFEQLKDSGGNLVFNADGSPTLLPKDNFLKDSNGNPYYQVISSGSPNAGAITLCAIGYSPDVNTPCTGTSVNVPYNQPIQPFVERFVGNSASPRVAIGFGVNWNSPFGPLRIDVSKALLTQPGDDPKLFTFNVGTQF